MRKLMRVTYEHRVCINDEEDAKRLLNRQPTLYVIHTNSLTQKLASLLYIHTHRYTNTNRYTHTHAHKQTDTTYVEISVVQQSPQSFNCTVQIVGSRTNFKDKRSAVVQLLCRENTLKMLTLLNLVV